MSSIRERALGPSTVLLVSLVAFVLLTPFLAEGKTGVLLVRVGFTAMLLAGFYVARRRGALRRFAPPIILFGIAVEWLTYFLRLPSGALARLLIDAILFLLLAVAQLSTILRQRRVSADTVVGGINAYLLIAISFMLVHSLLEALEPGAYRAGGGTLAEYVLGAERSEGFATMLYFSFVTITTLGYGDIVPVSAAAKLAASVEALFGQIYLATFIARLVALYAAGAKNGEPDA